MWRGSFEKRNEPLAGGYKPVEHTADLGLKAWGRNPRELLEEAAQGMIAQIVDPSVVREKEKVEISLEAESIEELLLQWLKEILFRTEREKLLFSRFQIEKDNFSIRNVKTAQIQASLYGERIDPARHDICLEIKAVTRHGFYVKKNGPWWEANILFDV
jgi:SHS2 domain-containing protein